MSKSADDKDSLPSIDLSAATEEIHPKPLVICNSNDPQVSAYLTRRRDSTPSVSTSASIDSEQQSLFRSLSRKLTSLRKAVQDDNEQTDANPQDLNELLKNQFDLEDALRLHTNTEEAPVQMTAQDKPLTNVSDDQQTITKVFTNKSTGNLDLPPDGGYGWVCCLCVTLIMFSTWGCNSGFGVFLAYYLNNNTFLDATKYDYALIAGITVCLGQGLALVAMIAMRVVGFKQPMYFGTVLLFAGFLLASFSTKLWQLYLTQGVLIGIGISFIFVPATTVLPGWFLKKRSFSMGISLIGTGAGGVTYSLSVNALIQRTGDQKWALRTLAITCTVTCIVAILLIKQRVPLKPTGLKSKEAISQLFKILFSPRVFKMYSVQLIGAWFSMALFGYNLMVFTLSSYAVAKGMSRHQGSILTAALNASQAVGRPLMGLMGDKFGRTNTTVALTTILTTFLFAFWIPSDTFLQMIFFSICVGFCVGVANVMNTVLVADMVKPQDFLPAWGYINTVSAPFMLVCEVIAQALTDHKNKNNPYLHTQIFAGLCFFCALLLIILLREYTVRLRLTERQEINYGKLKEVNLDANDAEVDNQSLLEERRAKYAYLLGPGVKKFLLRMFYPMKV